MLSVQFWAVNALNLGDYFLTKIALANGAVEGNPIVRFIGLNSKLVLVLIASLLIERLRPKRLWLVVPVLGAVVVYSTTNLMMI